MRVAFLRAMCGLFHLFYKSQIYVPLHVKMLVGTDDVYQHALIQIHTEAPPELVQSFKEKMEFIRVRYTHSEKTINSCMEGLSNPPTLMELLTAAFVVNGGVLFKHGPELGDEHAAEQDFNEFMDEIQRLGLGGGDASSTSSQATEDTIVHQDTEADPLTNMVGGIL